MIFRLHRGLSTCTQPHHDHWLGGLKLHNDNDAGFPKLPAPARRALSDAGYTRLDQLAEVSESELKKLHGMGPTAVTALRAALERRGLSFRS
jgi:hypothetical protein